MIHWTIIRTDYKREEAVAREIGKHFPAWVPMIAYIHARKLPSQKKAIISLKTRPLMATYLFAAVPGCSLGELQAIDGYRRYECHSGSWVPLTVPETQLAAFRGMIDGENAGVVAHHKRVSVGKMGKRAKTFKGLGEEALREIMQELFGA